MTVEKEKRHYCPDCGCSCHWEHKKGRQWNLDVRILIRAVIRLLFGVIIAFVVYPVLFIGLIAAIGIWVYDEDYSAFIDNPIYLIFSPYKLWVDDREQDYNIILSYFGCLIVCVGWYPLFTHIMKVILW